MFESKVYFKESGHLYYSFQIVSPTEYEQYRTAYYNNQTQIIHEPGASGILW
jgi:hypothetical protein